MQNPPAPDQDWHAQSSVNVKVVSHVVNQKLSLVARILKKKMNGLNVIFVVSSLIYLAYHNKFFWKFFLLLSEYASILNLLDLFSSLMSKYLFLINKYLSKFYCNC